jgi:hypothetical protein
MLINRCKEILESYSRDEEQAGTIKLPQARIMEVVFVLKEL